MNVEQVPISELSVDPGNARQHDRRNIDTIKGSLRRFDQQKPIVARRDGTVIAGNGTLEAARELGWDTIGVHWSDLEGAEAAAYAIADNRTAELAEWDDSALAETLASIQNDQSIDELVTGFDEKEIKELITKSSGGGEVDEDEPPAAPADPVTQPGDLWVLGEHRVLCGDATDGEAVDQLMQGERVGLCFTSPPYAQQRDYTAEAKKKVQDWDGLMRGVFAYLPMTDDGQVLVNLGLVHRDGEWVPYWEDWIAWMREQGWRRFGWYVWDQGFGLPGDWNGRFGPAHEWLFHFNTESVRPEKWTEKQPENIKPRHQGESTMRKADGTTAAFTNPSASGQATKVPDSVVRIGRQVGSDGHPAQFPVALPTAVVMSWPRDAYDPFLGSGTTLIAAEQLGRRCFGMEISPAYCDVICKRYMALTGDSPVRESDGERFSDLLA